MCLVPFFNHLTNNRNMNNDYEFEKGQAVIWTQDNGNRVYGTIIDRTKDTVFIQRRDLPEPVEVHRGLFSKIELV